MSTLTSILNRDYEGFTTLKIKCSFSDSFCYSFPESSRSLDFPFDLISKLKHLSSSNGLRFIARASMNRFILQLMSVNCTSNHSNLSLLDLEGNYEQTCSPCLEFLLLLFKMIHGSFNFPKYHKRKICSDTNMICKLSWIFHKNSSSQQF
jgi:hypothetical protein